MMMMMMMMIIIIIIIITILPRAVTQLIEALRYKPESRGFDSRRSH